jgi:catechol 2,3-dioxygenase-like lactoylglutathione lyase family enzyme
MRARLLMLPTTEGAPVLSNAAVIAFSATRKPEAAKEFYRDKLGLKLIEESPYALVFRTGNAMLRVQLVGDFVPHPFTAVGWDVPDIRATVAELAAQSIAMLRFDFIDQDDAGIWWTPDGNGVAWFNDPDGNTLSLTQFS